jgi:hypothetical protein
LSDPTARQSGAATDIAIVMQLELVGQSAFKRPIYLTLTVALTLTLTNVLALI